MTHAELVEVMHSAYDQEMELIGDELQAGGFVAPADQIRRGCEAALSALREQGLAVVPRRATDEMLWNDGVSGVNALWKGPRSAVPKGMLRDLWEAMLAAGEIRPGEDGND